MKKKFILMDKETSELYAASSNGKSIIFETKEEADKWIKEYGFAWKYKAHGVWQI